jgi:diaminopimelate epimerase
MYEFNNGLTFLLFFRLFPNHIARFYVLFTFTAMQLKFFKYHGAGNDFVILDGRVDLPSLSVEQVRFLCDRRFGIGGDGLMILKPTANADFEMLYFNSDGRPGSMCGNGGRCMMRFASDLNLISSKADFLAPDGLHEAYFLPNGWVSLKMNDVLFPSQNESGDFILDTGSPHYVSFRSDVKSLDVFNEGRAIRNSQPFKEKGINVNFVSVENNTLHIRTYERGVEEETLSCGTGITASVIAAHFSNKVNSDLQSVDVIAMGGELKVSFKKNSDKYVDVRLEGPAVKVFEGYIDL